MIILIKNNKDAFEACLNAMNRMLLTPENSSTGSKITYKQKAILDYQDFDIRYKHSGNKIMSYRTLLRVFRLSRFMRFNILAPFCAAASTLASPAETKKDKFLFGVKLFGLILLGIPLALSVTALILPVALVSHPITHSIGRIVSKIKGNKDGKEIPPEDITFGEFFYKAQAFFMNSSEQQPTPAKLEDVLTKCKSKYDDAYRHPMLETVTEYSDNRGYILKYDKPHTNIVESKANPCGKIDQVMAFGGFYR